MRLHRLQNLMLQKLYRPASAGHRFLSPTARQAMDELDQWVEQKITPLLSELTHARKQKSTDANDASVYP